MNKFLGRPALWLATGLLSAAIASFMLSGCSPSAPSAPATKSNDLFVSWLRAHGESNIVVDANGVGIAGNPTRLRYRLEGHKEFTNGVTAELEFRVRVPDGREIIEHLAGVGESLPKAEDDGKANFVLSTFHVVYRSFMNSSDPHQHEEKATLNGQPRALVLGEVVTRGALKEVKADEFPLRSRIGDVLARQPLSAGPHWMKIVYANNHSKTMLCEVTFDNQGSRELTDAVQNLPWPKPNEFYMAKQFIIVK